MILKGRLPILPTEDPDKVLKCIVNLFPESEVQTSTDEFLFQTSDPSKFFELLREQQIRDTAIMVIERRLSGDSTDFNLNKQAAFMGRINFTEGDSTLGDLHIEVLEGAQELIENIRPRFD